MTEDETTSTDGPSEEVLEGLAAKLHALAEGLEPDERAALDLVLTRAADVGEADVSGFMNVGLQFLELSRTQTSLRTTLLRTFSPAGGAPWEQIEPPYDRTLPGF